MQSLVHFSLCLVIHLLGHKVVQIGPDAIRARLAITVVCVQNCDKLDTMVAAVAVVVLILYCSRFFVVTANQGHDQDLVWKQTPNAWHQQIARIVDHRFV